MPTGWDDELSEGFLADYNITVDESRWVAGQYGLQLVWKGTTDDPTVPNVTAYFSAPNGWDCFDGGITAVHTEADKTFTKTSQVGKLIERAKELGVTPILREKAPAGYVDATAWEGLRFKMETPKVETQPNAQTTRQRPYPVEFLGRVDDGVNTARPTTAAAAVAAVESQPTTPTAASTDDVRATVESLAKATESYEAFRDTAVKLPGVQTNTELLMDILKADGIHARSRAVAA